MERSTFDSRFDAAVDDFANKRKIKDELAAYASARVGKLGRAKSLPEKQVVHQIMLAAAYPELKPDARVSAYNSMFPWWYRAMLCVIGK